MERLLKWNTPPPPPEKVIPNNLIELCVGYAPIEITPKELYRYFDLILYKKFSIDKEDLKAGFQPGRMVYMTVDYHFEKFGNDKELALRNLAGLVKMAKKLYSQDKQYAVQFCRFHDLYHPDPIDEIL